MTILYLNPALLNFGPGPAVHGNALVEHLRGIGESVVTYPSLHQTLSANRSGIPLALRQVKSELPSACSGLFSAFPTRYSAASEVP